MTAPTSRTPVTETAAPPRRKALNPIVKFILELGPLALFFIVYGRLGIFAATGVLMASVLVTLGVSYAMLRRIPIMPLVTAVIVLIFGSLTLIFHDETLIKIKPTALYILFAAALFVGLWLNKPLLKILFDGAIQVTEEGWRKLTWRWAFFFLALAVLNEMVWRTQTTDLWVKFKTFGFLPLTLLFAVSQAPLIMKYESQGRGSERRTLRGAEGRSSGVTGGEDNRGASWGQINPRKTKQNQAKRLGFPCILLAELGLFNGLQRIQIKKPPRIRLASQVVRKDLRRLPVSCGALQSPHDFDQPKVYGQVRVLASFCSPQPARPPGLWRSLTVEKVPAQPVPLSRKSAREDIRHRC